MLIDGAMTLARDSGELLSIEGRLVKSPSFWTRQVHVTRRYARIAGIRVPVAMESRAKVLVMGASTFDMSYRYLSINGAPVAGQPRCRRDGGVRARMRHAGRDGRPGPARRRITSAPSTSTCADRSTRPARHMPPRSSSIRRGRRTRRSAASPNAWRRACSSRGRSRSRSATWWPSMHPAEPDHRVSPAVGRRHRLSGRQRSVRSRGRVGALPPRRHARSVLDLLSRTDSGRRGGRAARRGGARHATRRVRPVGQARLDAVGLGVAADRGGRGGDRSGLLSDRDADHARGATTAARIRSSRPRARARPSIRWPGSTIGPARSPARGPISHASIGPWTCSACCGPGR